MDTLDLAGIRARLQTVTEAEGRAARKSRFELPGLWRGRRSQPPSPVRPSLPPPRRVGVRPSPEIEPESELLLEPPLDLTTPLDPKADDEAALRRNAFGQRREPAMKTWRPPPVPEPLSVMDEDVGEALRRMGSTLARASRVPLETPDVADDLDRARPTGPATTAGPVPPRRLILRRAAKAEASMEPINPEAELLQHLERVFLAEHAGLEAHRLSA
jgi:hypothetical protein